MRNCECICTPPMFQSRVMGVGSQRPQLTEEALVEICDKYGGTMTGSFYCPEPSRLAVCHPQSPAGTCKPVDWTPPAAVPDAPAKPKGSALPLVIGAALLLLS